MKRLILSIGLAATLAIGTASAQDALAVLDQPAEASASRPAVQALSLQDAVEIALDRNLNLQRSASQVTLDEQSVSQARAEFLPNLNLSVSPSVRVGQSFDQTTAQLGSETSSSVNLGASSSMSIYDGGRNLATLRQAERSLDATRGTYAWAQQGTVYQTTTQFLQVFLNEELIRVEEENLAAQRQQLERIEAFHAAGNLSNADVLQQRAQIAQSEQRLLTARRNAETSRLRLKQTLNIDPQVQVALAPLSDDLVATMLAEPVAGANELVQQALVGRDDVAAQRLQIDAAQQGVRAAAAGYLPSVSVSASTGTSYSSRSEAFGMYDQLASVNPSGGVSVSVSIPIFDRQRTSASVQRAEVALSNERLALEIMQQETAFAVQQALLEVAAAEAQLRAADAQALAAAEALEATEARYNAGASTLLELTQARALQTEAAARQAEARHAMVDSRLTLAYNTGTIGTLVSSL